MHKRLPLLAVCLGLAAFGASACGPSTDRASSASATPAAASVPASAAPSGSPSTAPTEVRRLILLPVYLKTIRKNHPDLDGISDDVLIAHGNAICGAGRGQALVDQIVKTKQELGLTGQQAAEIGGASTSSFCA
ncbi:DUF732 domain-containing protein [Streptomyces sp. NPDC059382]|uniref:DUF732 domain-containing protein n=1 Tax=Streptomyces sp. NPDC059382 TaxID=3346816 RepID=UPI0036AF2E71